MTPLAAIRAAIPRLRAGGFAVVEVAGWETRGYDALTPVGVMNHHTAGGTTSTNQRDVDEIRDGRGGPNPLEGPLANFLTGNDGTIYVVAARRARHAGAGAAEVLARTKRNLPPLGDAIDLGYRDAEHGNRNYFGNEVDHPGDGRLYPTVQIDAVAALNAELCRAYDWLAVRAIQHREWTRRKPDMSWRGDLRGRVAALLTPTPAPPAAATDPQREDPDVAVLVKAKDDPKVWITNGVHRRWVRSQAELTALHKAGVVATKTPVEVSRATLTALVEA